MAFNLEVPIELCEYGMNSATTAYASTYQRINFNPANYDGATYYFEIVAINGNTTNAYNVGLRDVSNSSTKVNISVPANTTARTRFRSSSFTPASGNYVYAVYSPATAVASNVVVYEARIIVVQSNATKTRIQVPLLNRNYNDSAAYNAQYVENRNVGTDGQSVSRYFPIWLYESKYFTTVPSLGFALESALASSNASATATVTLYNKTDNTTIASVTRASTTPAVVTQTWSSGLTNWHDGDQYEIRHKISNTSYYSRPGNAYLYITLNPIVNYQVLWKLGLGRTAGTGALINEYQRALITTNNYDNETVYFECTGYCADNGNRVHLQDDSTNDSGTGGSNVTGADINFNSGTKARVRTGAVTLTSGNRYIVDIDSSTNNLEFAQANLLICSPLNVPLSGTINGSSSVATASLDGGYHNLLKQDLSNGKESGTAITELVPAQAGSPNVVFTADNSNEYSGSYCISAYSNSTYRDWLLDPNDLPLIDNQTDYYTFSLRLKNPSDGFWIALPFFNSSKVLDSYTNTYFAASSSYVKREITGKPVNGTEVYVGIYGGADLTSAQTSYLDELMLAKEASAGTWVEGRPSTVIQALSGTIAGSSQITGALIRSLALAGTVNGSGNVSGAMAVSKPLSGTIQSTSTVTGVMGLIQRLSGAINGSSTLTGAMAVAKPLGGIINGSSTVTGSINKAVSLAGIINGSSTVTGAVGVAKRLSGVINGSSTVTGAILLRKGLSGVIQGSSTVTGNLQKAVSLGGVINGSSTVSGVIKNAVSLSGTIAGTSTVTGLMGMPRSLSGVIQGTSTVTGNLKKAVSLSGVVQGTSTVTGLLGIRRPLSGVIQGSSTVAGNIQKAVSLSGVINGASTVTGSLRNAVSLGGAINGVSTVTGVLLSQGQVVLRGIIEGTSTITGSLSVSKSLSGSIQGTSTVTGAMGLIKQLSGIIQSSSTITGSISRSLQLAGSIEATSTITGALGGIMTYLSGTISATSTITGALKRLVYREDIDAVVEETKPTTNAVFKFPVARTVINHPTTNSEINTPGTGADVKKPTTVAVIRIT